MGRRHPDYRRVKLHHSYTLAELAAHFDIHINTVRSWQREGLKPVDDKRPALFHGSFVRAFLMSRRANAKRPTGPGRIYCLPCRKPKNPDGGTVDYRPETATAGRVEGLCPDCGRLIFRKVARAALASVAAGLDVQFPHAQPRLREGSKPSVNCDFGEEIEQR